MDKHWFTTPSRFEASDVTALPGVTAGTYGDTGNVAQFTVDSKVSPELQVLLFKAISQVLMLEQVRWRWW